MAGIFISYRRNKDDIVAWVVYKLLAARFGDNLVFIDRDPEDLQAKWRLEIEQKIANCDVMLVIIGRGWARMTKDSTVVWEIQTALRMNKPVIPVLLTGAKLPSRKKLVRLEIEDLTSRNAAKLRAGRDFKHDVAHLINILRQDFLQAALVCNTGGQGGIGIGDGSDNGGDETDDAALKPFFRGLNQHIRQQKKLRRENEVTWLRALGDVRRAIWNLEKEFAEAYRHGLPTVSREQLVEMLTNFRVDECIILDLIYLNVLKGCLECGPIQPYRLLTDVVGPEETEEVAEVPYRWILDPIDGSRHFRRGLPLFATSVTLEFEGRAVAAIIYVPVTKELFFAVEGIGAYLNDWSNELHVSKMALQDKNAMLHVEFPNVTLKKKKGKVREFKRLCRAVSEFMGTAYRVRGLGIGALGLAYVAKGAFEGYVTLPGTTQRTDVAGGTLLVKEAGGVVCIQETPDIADFGIRVIASNKQSFGDLKKIIGGEGWKNV